VVSNIQGKPYAMGKPGIVATNGHLQKPLLAALKKALSRKNIWPPK
jgi:hypothetical protein